MHACLGGGEKASFGAYPVTGEEVIEFASKDDMQPFPLSDEAAAKTHFGRIAASGWHTCAMTMAMIAKNVVETEQAGLGSPGVDELRWLKPVYPGDTLRIECEVVDVRPARSPPDIGSFRTAVTVLNQDDGPVWTSTLVALVRRRAAD